MTDNTTSSNAERDGESPRTPQTFHGRLKWIFGWFYYLIAGGLTYALGIIVLFVFAREPITNAGGPEAFTFVFGLYVVFLIAAIGKFKS